MNEGDRNRILSIDTKIKQLNAEIDRLNEEIDRLKKERKKLVGPVQSPEPEPDDPRPVIASLAPPQTQLPVIEGKIEGEHIETGAFPRPKKLGYTTPFEARRFPAPIKDNPPPGWGYHIWRQTLNDPVKVWRCIDKLPRVPVFYTSSDPPLVYSPYASAKKRGGVTCHLNTAPKDYTSNNTMYEKVWGEEDDPMDPNSELPKEYDLSELGFLVQLIPKNFPATLVSSTKWGITESNPIVGVIAGKKLDTNEYVVIIPDVNNPGCWGRDARSEMRRRPFEGYSIPSVGYGSGDIIHLLPGLGISNDIIINVYDSQTPGAVHVTCILCPPIRFNGDIYVGCVPWFPSGCRVRWSPDVVARMKKLNELNENVDILPGVKKPVAGSYDPVEIKKPYRDSWDKVFTLYYNPRPKGNALFIFDVHQAYSEKPIQAAYSWRWTRSDGSEIQIGKHELCPCGSGKKYRDCHKYRSEWLHYPQFNDLYLAASDDVLTMPPRLKRAGEVDSLIIDPATGRGGPAIACSPFDLVLQNMTGGSLRINRRKRNHRKRVRQIRTRKRGKSKMRRSHLKPNLN